MPKRRLSEECLSPNMNAKWTALREIHEIPESRPIRMLQMCSRAEYSRKNPESCFHWISKAKQISKSQWRVWWSVYPKRATDFTTSHKFCFARRAEAGRAIKFNSISRQPISSEWDIVTSVSLLLSQFVRTKEATISPMFSQSRSIEKFPVDPIPTFVPTWFNRAIDKTFNSISALANGRVNRCAVFQSSEWVNAATRSRALGAYCWVDKSEKASYHAICLPTSEQQRPLIVLNSRAARWCTFGSL